MQRNLISRPAPYDPGGIRMGSLCLLIPLLTLGCGNQSEEPNRIDHDPPKLVEARTDEPRPIQFPFRRGTRYEYLTYGINAGFGVWSAEFSGRHLGQDIDAPTGTALFAIAPGTVRVSDGQSSFFPGYGNACGDLGSVVLVDHVLPDGEQVVCLYGPVRRGAYEEVRQSGLIPEGSVVKTGQYMAQIADYWADTDHDGRCRDVNWDHLHFGCRRGAFDPSSLRKRHVRSYSTAVEDVDIDSRGAKRGGLWTHPELLIYRYLNP